MSAGTIGLISGILVAASAIPYSARVYQKKIHPNISSWSLWTVLGFALLLTYRSSGAEANVWPAIFGFVNPLVITTLIILRKNGEWTRPSWVEIACIIFGLLSLGLWIVVRESRELAQYALYVAIVADSCAAIPTTILVWKQPDCDRPFAWASFAIAYGLAIFAITEHTVANYALPIYMFFGAGMIALPLALFRWRKRTPLSEWI